MRPLFRDFYAVALFRCRHRSYVCRSIYERAPLWCSSGKVAVCERVLGRAAAQVDVIKDVLPLDDEPRMACCGFKVWRGQGSERSADGRSGQKRRVEGVGRLACATAPFLRAAQPGFLRRLDGSPSGVHHDRAHSTGCPICFVNFFVDESNINRTRNHVNHVFIIGFQYELQSDGEKGFQITMLSGLLIWEGALEDQTSTAYYKTTTLWIVEKMKDAASPACWQLVVLMTAKCE